MEFTYHLSVKKAQRSGAWMWFCTNRSKFFWREVPWLERECCYGTRNSQEDALADACRHYRLFHAGR